MGDVILQGITWGHSRGLTPLQAASQRYSELHPGVEIRWKKRTLQEFADFPIEELTKDYDLLVIDHPWVGCAAATGCVLPLEEHLPAAYLQDQLDHSVGGSHESYNYEGKQWALAIDAAAPAASYRQDLLLRHYGRVPQQWEEVLELASMGRVAVPAIPIDILMNFYSFCIAGGEEPFLEEGEVVSESVGLAAIETMKELYGRLPEEMFGFNPIAVAERMTTTDDYWYCPFAYCYSNYSRKGFSDNPLRYTDVVQLNGERLQTTVGGTGLAVSAFGRHKDIALDFAAKLASPQWQAGLYVQHGGQPGHRTAWLNPMANALTGNFFLDVLPVMNNGYIRPRYNGYLHFQDNAGNPLQACLMGNLKAADALSQMNAVYRQSLLHQTSTVAL